MHTCMICLDNECNCDPGETHCDTIAHCIGCPVCQADADFYNEAFRRHEADITKKTIDFINDDDTI